MLSQVNYYLESFSLCWLIQIQVRAVKVMVQIVSLKCLLLSESCASVLVPE